jgi:hypothetical protein
MSGNALKPPVYIAPAVLGMDAAIKLVGLLPKCGSG